MIEKWASQEALATHSTSAALTKMNARLAGKLTGRPDVQIVTPHPAGTAEQGAL
jgi:quinol monooxygenase YgiN